MPTKSTGAQSSNINSPQSNSTEIFSARVKYCILDNKTEPQAFNSKGEWNSIGGIFWENVKYPNPNPNKSKTSGKFAKPLFPNSKIYPLENEIVYVIRLASIGVETDTNKKCYYYFQPINIWNSNHHNAIPDGINNSTLPPSQQRTFDQTEAGSVKRVTNKGVGTDLGSTFKEKLNIKSLQPFEGDIIHEGRWGQSIRFGSTVSESKIPNPWSKVGENGNPLTIIRNGQHDDGKEKLIPQVEDINKDLSSIYLTSDQEIPISPSSAKYNSYETPPILPNKFSEDQVIINSGRLLFNSKKDSILMSSKDTINLNSINSVNIDSPQTIIQSKEILLGSKSATESVILGDKFLEDLLKLLTEINLLGNILGSTPIMIAPFTPSGAHIKSATTMASRAQGMISKIETYKSKTTKSK
tara:strand:+ start:173 stop:1408 length:1236 start_codon:yes stop_codon:yes gene_type:complete